MRILVLTPLYPPDRAPQALYVKEVVRRLSSAHTVSLLAYARLPEPVAGVPIQAIDKRKVLLFRLLSFFFALMRQAAKADLILAENGASVELPLILASFMRRTPVIVHVGDAGADAKAHTHTLLSFLEQLAFARAKEVVRDMPLARPDIIPFLPEPLDKTQAYEESWSRHLDLLQKQFSYVV